MSPETKSSKLIKISEQQKKDRSRITFLFQGEYLSKEEVSEIFKEYPRVLDWISTAEPGYKKYDLTCMEGSKKQIKDDLEFIREIAIALFAFRQEVVLMDQCCKLKYFARHQRIESVDGPSDITVPGIFMAQFVTPIPGAKRRRKKISPATEKIYWEYFCSMDDADLMITPLIKSIDRNERINILAGLQAERAIDTSYFSKASSNEVFVATPGPCR